MAKKTTDKQLLDLTKERIAEHLRNGEKVPRELTTLVSSLNKSLGKKNGKKNGKKKADKRMSDEAKIELESRLFASWNRHNPDDQATTPYEAYQKHKKKHEGDTHE